jgi:hypothetical protein
LFGTSTSLIQRFVSASRHELAALPTRSAPVADRLVRFLDVVGLELDVAWNELDDE